MRAPTPADLNGTAEPPASFGALCDAQQAQAIFKEFDVCGYGARWWACAALLAVIAAIVIVATA